MKFHLFTLLFVFATFGQVFSQDAKAKPFKGKIVYKISYEKSDMDDEVTSMLPKLMSMYIIENKAKTDLVTELGTQSAVYDLQQKTKTALMDFMGGKYAIKDTWETIQAEQQKKPIQEVVFTDETKNIAGFNCRKAVIKTYNSVESPAVENIAWFTDEIQVNPEINFTNPVYKDIKDLLMEYELEAGNGLKMNFTAFSVEKMKIPAKDFEIPEGYTMVTRDELMQIFNK